MILIQRCVFCGDVADEEVDGVPWCTTHVWLAAIA
jgi:hypothetical protein